MDQDEVEARKLAEKNEATSLANKGFILRLSEKFFSRDMAGSPERTR